MDRISDLPNEIIGHIGSFLSAKEAAFAMVLSKRWRNMFTIIQDLRYNDLAPVINNGESFMDFSDRVFALPVTSRVRKFYLRWFWFEVTETAEYDHINRCLCHVLKRGVLDLELLIDFKEGGYYSLPLEVFTCETVAKLTLGYGFVIDFLPAVAFLPSLTTLCLHSIRFHEFGRCAFNTLLSASPVLEELVIYGVEFERWKWSSTISSPTLQRLTLCRTNFRPDLSGIALDCRGLAYEFDSLSFDTPGLTYLEYGDYVPKEYPFVNLNSLVQAKLDLLACLHTEWEEGNADDFNPMNLINAIKNVEILNLSVETMQMIYVFRKVIPVFENLFHLSLRFSNKLWVELPILLKKSPNLETLIIKDSLYDNDPEEESVCPDVLSCHVEVLKIMKYKGIIQELEQMKHFLKKLSCLELVEVCAQVKVEERVRVLTDLLMLQRASTNCEIQVKFS